MLLPELASEEATAAARIEQLAAQLLEAEANIRDLQQRLDGTRSALICEEGWRKRLWAEKEALKALLGVFADRGNWIAGEDGNYHYSVTWCGESDAPWNIARKGLGHEESDGA